MNFEEVCILFCEIGADFREFLKGEVRRIPLPRTPVDRGQESAEGPCNAEETGMLPYNCSLPKLDPGDLADWPLQNVRGSLCERLSDLGSSAVVGAFSQTRLTSQLFRGLERSGNRRRTSGVLVVSPTLARAPRTCIIASRHAMWRDCLRRVS